MLWARDGVRHDAGAQAALGAEADAAGASGGALAGLPDLRAQCIELGLQTSLVLGQGLLEQTPLVGAHGLGLGAELPTLQARQLKLHLLQLGLAQRDLAVLACNLSILVLQLASLLLDVFEHLPGQRRNGIRRQTLQVMGREVAQVEHEGHRARHCMAAPSAQLPLPTCCAHARQMRCSSGRRCQGRPSTRASN